MRLRRIDIVRQLPKRCHGPAGRAQHGELDACGPAIQRNLGLVIAGVVVQVDRNAVPT